MGFMQNAFDESGVAQELQTLSGMFPKQKSQDQAANTLIAAILTALPCQSICDELVQTYTSNWEGVYRVLHLPSFNNECQRFWIADHEDKIFKFTNFVPQLALVAATASILYKPTPASRSAGSDQVNASQLCDLIGSWLQGLKGKQRVKISTLQTQCLHILARISLCAPSVELWSSTGDLVRSALTMGLHRDPSHLPSIPIHLAELRRRLWFTVAELDVEFSLLCSLPSLLQSIDYSCQVPANVDDCDLTLDLTSPVEMVDNNFTDTSFQIALACTLPQRIKALRLISLQRCSLQMVLDCLHEIDTHYFEIPAASRSTSQLSKAGCLMNSIFISSYLRRPIMSLCAMVLIGRLSIGREERRGLYNKCVQCGMKTIAQIDEFDVATKNEETAENPLYFDLFEAFCGNDVIRAAYLLCLSMDSDSSPISEIPHITLTPSVSIDWPFSIIQHELDKVVRTFVERTPKLRSRLKELISLALVLESVKAARSQRKDEMMRAGFNRVVQYCRNRFSASERAKEFSESDTPSSHTSPDSFNQLLSQEFGTAPLDPFGFEWDFGVLPDLYFDEASSI
jgi:Fungal specific transcription factor domain